MTDLTKLFPLIADYYNKVLTVHLSFDQTSLITSIGEALESEEYVLALYRALILHHFITDGKVFSLKTIYKTTYGKVIKTYLSMNESFKAGSTNLILNTRALISGIIWISFDDKKEDLFSAFEALHTESMASLHINEAIPKASPKIDSSSLAAKKEPTTTN